MPLHVNDSRVRGPENCTCFNYFVGGVKRSHSLAVADCRVVVRTSTRVAILARTDNDRRCDARERNARASASASEQNKSKQNESEQNESEQNEREPVKADLERERATRERERAEREPERAERKAERAELERERRL